MEFATHSLESRILAQKSYSSNHSWHLIEKYTTNCTLSRSLSRRHRHVPAHASVCKRVFLLWRMQNASLHRGFLVPNHQTRLVLPLRRGNEPLEMGTMNSNSTDASLGANHNQTIRIKAWENILESSLNDGSRGPPLPEVRQTSSHSTSTSTDRPASPSTFILCCALA